MAELRRRRCAVEANRVQSRADTALVVVNKNHGLRFADHRSQPWRGFAVVRMAKQVHPASCVCDDPAANGSSCNALAFAGSTLKLEA
jgi:hypothetical protein